MREMSEERPIRVVIVDDHPILRIGLSMYLERNPRIRIVGEADNGFDAVRLISEELPDVVLMDIDMPGLSGIEATRLLRKGLPELIVIVLSTYTKKEYIQEAMAEGATATWPRTPGSRNWPGSWRILPTVVPASPPICSTWH